ncbi:MAG: carbohydrate binding domain-containing protein, partial [Candidatus Brocadiae bacterium]|nr:carbohydrate binding domain-containing protein [Candidatus Brocadiia bacterium]
DMFRLYEGEYVAYGEAGRASAQPENSFVNPSFEMGPAIWNLGKEAATEASLEVNAEDAADGERSALLTLGSVSGWGVQFGQRVAAGQQGKTYTFAALGKSVGGPVAVGLEIERPADPWDRAARSGQVMLSQDKWTELHTTFTVEVPFPEGWSAYVSCTQPNARFRLDMLRLYEGDYVPYGQEAEGQAAAPVRPPVAAAPAPAAPPQPMTPEVGLFDTGSPSPWPLAGDTLLVREGWTQLAEDDVDHEFAGDAVFLNNKLAVALRRDGRGAELYSVGGTTPKIRGVLVPAASDSPARLSSVKVRENTSNAVALDARFQTTGGEEVTLAYELRMGEPFVKTEPGEGVDGLRIQAPCRFAVLPDFVADDVVLDATALHVAQAELPGEHLFLHLLKDREAIVMAVWTSADRDIRLNLSGQGRHRTINSSEIYYGKDGAIWVAVLEAPGVWHAHDVAGRDAGKVVRLDWRAPWPGHWRVDWTRDDNLTGSWEMLSEGSDGRYSKPTWYGYSGRVGANRSRWTTVLGTFNYPCWTDKD